MAPTDYFSRASGELATVVNVAPRKLAEAAAAIQRSNKLGLLGTMQLASARADATHQALALHVRTVVSALETADVLSDALDDGLRAETLMAQKLAWPAMVAARAVIENASCVIWTFSGDDPASWSTRILRLERTSEKYASKFAEKGGTIAGAVPPLFEADVSRSSPVQWGSIVESASDDFAEWDFPLSPIGMWNLASGLAHGQSWATALLSSPDDARLYFTQVLAGAVALTSYAHEWSYRALARGMEAYDARVKEIGVANQLLRAGLREAWVRAAQFDSTTHFADGTSAVPPG